jgi:uncharacterized protein
VPELSSPESFPVSPAAKDYEALVIFLLTPFLEEPTALKVNCEIHLLKAKVWVRIAFADADKGRVFGRGGRTIQAIRTLLEAAAGSYGHTLRLDIFGEREHRSEAGHHDGPKPRSSPTPYQPPIPKK